MPTYTGTNGDNILNGSNGDDMINGLAGNDTINGGNGNDTIDGGDDNDTIDGGNGNDTLAGGSGDDTIVGDNGDDDITGGGGNDSLDGGNDDDFLSGGLGTDVLTGGAGSDTLTGGDDADAFSFQAASNGADEITDFVHGIDQIRVSASGFGGGLIAGGTVSLVSGANPTASGGGGQFLFDTDDGRLFWDADGTGGGAAVLVATLSNIPSLTTSDFAVI